jgi:hypothetical protein
MEQPAKVPIQIQCQAEAAFHHVQRLSLADAADLELHPDFVAALQSQPDTRCEVTAAWFWVGPSSTQIFSTAGTITPVKRVGLT